MAKDVSNTERLQRRLALYIQTAQNYESAIKAQHHVDAAHHADKLCDILRTLIADGTEAIHALLRLLNHGDQSIRQIALYGMKCAPDELCTILEELARQSTPIRDLAQQALQQRKC